MIETIRQGLQAEGITVSISKLCRWFGVPRRTVYYRAVKAEPKLQERLVAPIKAMIEVRIPLIADTHSKLIADSVPGDRGHPG